MTSCAMLGMNMYDTPGNHASESASMLTSRLDPVQKQKRMLKKIDNKISSLTRLVTVLIVIELIRIMQT